MSRSLLVLAVVPLLWTIGAGEHALGHTSVDLLGHLWHHWHSAQEGLTHTTLVRFPEGVDLLPITGGWLDVWLGGHLVGLLGLVRAWNAVLGLFVLVAGVGGATLARTLGAAPWTAALAGVLLQLDGFLLLHLAGGRSEQVGLGLVALTLAAGLRLVQPAPARTHVVLAAGSAALVVATSWELALMTAVGMVGLGALVVRRDSARAVASALGLAAVLSLPMVAPFLTSTLAARAANPSFGGAVSEVASLGLLEWLGPQRPGPHTLTLLCLLALPWTARESDRRSWLAVVVLLITSLGLALGASPALHRGGAPFWTGPTPWSLAAQLPVLEWFHWPDRLTLLWSLIAPTAAALALTHVARRSKVGGRGTGGVDPRRRPRGTQLRPPGPPGRVETGPHRRHAAVARPPPPRRRLRRAPQRAGPHVPDPPRSPAHPRPAHPRPPVLGPPRRHARRPQCARSPRQWCAALAHRCASPVTGAERTPDCGGLGWAARPRLWVDRAARWGAAPGAVGRREH